MEKHCQLDRETLKELGIKSIGRQLELLRNVKSLFGKKVTLIKIYKKVYLLCVYEVACAKFSHIYYSCRTFQRKY